jgi:prophage maintenance system killer protein
MASLHYLTIQDILWINLQVTKKVRHFNYARLEEATFYQYAYGDSNTLFPQAARFVSGFVKMHPFETGNEATAFVACLAFLEMNGYVTKSGDLVSWFDRASSKQVEGAAAIEEIAVADDEAHHGLIPNIRAAIEDVLSQHASVIASLYSDAEKQTA